MLPAKFPWKRSNRNKSQGAIGFVPDNSPQAAQSPDPSSSSSPPAPHSVHGSVQPHRAGSLARSVSQRFPSNPLSDRSKELRRSFIQSQSGLGIQGIEAQPVEDHAYARTVTRAQSIRQLHSTPQSRPDSADAQQNPPPPPAWYPGLGLPDSTQQQGEGIQTSPPMSGQPGYTPSKSSSDSGQSAALDRWSQRRLQRLNTEQGFREQRQGQGVQGVLSPTSEHQTGYNPAVSQYAPEPQQPQVPASHQQAQPHPSQQGPYQTARAQPITHQNAGLVGSTPPAQEMSRSPNFQQYQDAPQVHMPPQQQQQQYSPPDSNQQYSAHAPRTQRSFTQQSGGAEDRSAGSMAASNNGALPAPKAERPATNRQSVHNGHRSEPTSASQGGQSQPANPVASPPTGQIRSGQAQPGGEVGRATPQPGSLSEDMSEEDVNQLIKDHKELREKYTKVKKYYFEKEDQVKQLQNSLAHQRLAQSRTSLDDSEYSTRFSRLDGLIAQLAFSIRKSWKTVPSWLAGSVNKDAISIGKQEMTAAGRAFISCWLVAEVFDKYFHPDLDPALSAQLKTMQKNIRLFAPAAQTGEEEEYLTAKVVNWRLTTLEGLQEMLRSPQCASNRQQLTDFLKDSLIQALTVHLDNPPMSDLEGGVHMIIELAVSMAIHLPLESRDVQIEYFMPGSPISTENCKVESGIPSLGTSVAEDAAERMSMKSAASDITDNADNATTGDAQPRKRGMLSALTGNKKAHTAQGKHMSGSNASLGRPESSSGQRDESPPRIRMAVGIGAMIRGRSVLVKAPIYST